MSTSSAPPDPVGAGEKPSIRGLLMILQLIGRADRRRAAIWGALVVVQALVPTAAVLAMAALVGAIPRAVGEGLSSDEGRALIWLLAFVVGLEIAGAGLGQVQGVVARQLRRRFALKIRMIIGSATLKPSGVAHMEDPVVADEINHLGGTERRSNLWAYLISATSEVALQYIVGLGAALILVRFRWWAPLVIAAAWISTTRWLIRSTALSVAEGRMTAGALRRSEYLRRTAAGGAAAKEVRIFGLGDWLVGRFATAWSEGMGGIWAERRRAIPSGLLTAVLVLVAHSVVLAALWRAAVSGELSLTALVAYIGAVLNMATLGPGTQAPWWLAEGAALMPRLMRLEEACKVGQVPAGAAPATGMPSKEIQFERVTFAYPRSTRNVFEDLDLRIPAGHSLALVGENGVGKTTLIKLLARMYEPTAGRILVDGVDIRELDLAEWRRRLAVIFQEFTRYELPLRDNVELASDDDTRSEPAVLDRAASLAGATALLSRLPGGWDTPLSGADVGGVELSGGEWQRVALTRALTAVTRGAGVLVLDEPTASLDVRGEAELFDRFLDVTQGTTTLLISHRFSTVRRAESICVISAGRVAELGSHDELIRANGLYAEMFNLQAERFRTPPTEAPG